VGKRAQQILKRFIDILTAALCLFLFSPIILLIALVIRLDSPGPVFYHHRRIGKEGKPFNLYKFRTMVAGGDDTEYMEYLKALIESERNGNGNGIPYRKMGSDQRVTRCGGWLRKYYLDELPQFWNVLKGEMSLVGPRPHVQLEVDYYTAEQRWRLLVRPGLTGLWQVRGKGDSTFNKLIALDLDYIEHWSLGLDLRILVQTLKVIARGGEGSWARAEKHLPDKKGKLWNRVQRRRQERRDASPQELQHREEETHRQEVG